MNIYRRQMETEALKAGLSWRKRSCQDTGSGVLEPGQRHDTEVQRGSLHHIFSKMVGVPNFLCPVPSWWAGCWWFGL